MREFVGNILDYTPDVQAYNEELNRIINETYLDFFVSQPWYFSQKTLDTYTIPDATAPGQITPAASANSFFIQSIDCGTVANNIGQRYNGGQMGHEGSILQITGASTAANNGLYVIDKIDLATDKIFVSKMSNRSDNRQLVTWEGQAGQAQNVSLSAQSRFLRLPKDCVQILDVGIRNIPEGGTGGIGEIYNLTRRNDERYSLRMDVTGTPTEYVMYDQAPNGMQDHTHFIPRANHDFFVDTVSNTPGWPQGTYSFKMAYQWQTIEGALSDEVTITINEANTIPRFNSRDTAKFGFRGLNKRFYVKYDSLTGYNSTKFSEPYYRDLAMIPFNELTNNGSKNVDGFIQNDNETQTAWPQANIQITTIDDLLAIPRHKAPINHRGRIRLHPRPTTELPIRIRYVSYPMLLADDHDSPETPIDTHRYIVYKATAEALFKHNNDAQSAFYLQKAEKELQKIEERYLTQRSAFYVKQSFRSGPLRLKPFRTLTKTTGADGS